MPRKYNLFQGAMESLNELPKEDRIFIQFKDRIKKRLKPNYFMHQDHFLRKWLIAREWKLEAAVQMFNDSCDFRGRMGADELLEKYQPPEVLQKYLTGGIIGFDKEGSPLRVELYGTLDMKGLMYSCRRSDLEKTKLMQCEHIVKSWKEQTEKLGRIVDGMTVIFDMEHISSRVMWRPGLNMYLHLVKVLEDNYPEMMKRMFVIHAPAIFPILWKLCRPLISEDMKKKIHVLGGDFQDVLRQYIHEEQLPAYLGGKITDPDGNPRCATMIGQGGIIPESFLITDLSNLESMETISVPNGTKHYVERVIDKPGCVLRWEFKTEDFDIGFGLLLKPPTNDNSRESSPVETLIPIERVNSHMVPEDGTYECSRPGTYIAVFDNSFSWARAKQMRHCIEVIEPEDSYKSELAAITNGFGCTNSPSGTIK